MKNRTVIVVAFSALLVTSAVVGVVSSTQNTATVRDQRPGEVKVPNVLGVTESRGNITALEPTVTDGFAVGDTSLRNQLRQEVIKERLSQTASEQARQAVLAESVSGLQNATDALAERATTSRSAYITGEITSEEYLRKLMRINGQANALLKTTKLLQDESEAESTAYMEATKTRARLLGYTGPLRDRLTTAVSNGTPITEIYVGASENGTNLAMISDGEYIRDANNPGAYEATGGQIPPAEKLLTNIRDYYPWVLNQSGGVSFSPLPVDASSTQYAYRLTLTYQSGEVNSYVDTSSQEVYQEVQQVDLNAVETVPDVSVQKQNTGVAIAKTFPGGPLQVNVSTNSGSAVQAQVYINGELAGETDQNGHVWMLTPPGEFTMQVQTSSDTIEIGRIRPQSSTLNASANGLAQPAAN